MNYKADRSLASCLDEWQCHKRVRAAKITRIGRPNHWPADVEKHIGPDTMLLDVPGGILVDPEPKMFARYRPVPGDYYVIYSAGTEREYHAISPRQEYEEGYAPIIGKIS